MCIALSRCLLRMVVKFFTLLFLLVIPILITHPFSAQAQPPNCGDGTIDVDEACDDGDTMSGDGCSAFCTIEPGYFCDNTMLPSICNLGCEITVEKDANPAYATPVRFLRLTLSFLPPVFDQFMLNAPYLPDKTFKVPVLSGTFIAEIPPNGWQLDNIDCGPEDILDIPDMADPIPDEFQDEFQDVGLGNLVFAVCLISGSATCTYTNSPIAGQACNINVDVESLNGGDTTFPFNISAGTLDQDFNLNVGQTMSFDDMPFSTMYTITEETVPDEWVFDGIVCEGDADFNQDVKGNSVEITCNSTGEVNCTFTNRSLIPPIVTNIPTLSEWGLIAMAGVLGLIGYMVIRRKKASA